MTRQVEADRSIALVHGEDLRPWQEGTAAEQEP